MPKTAVTVGPADHGHYMRLKDFDRAEGQEGYLYELSRGVVIVSDVPDPWHFTIVDLVRTQFILYRAAHPGRIVRVGGGGESKILLHDLESERHPDVSVYMTPTPKGKNIWAKWVPEIVVEVVSRGSEERDYAQKREEYLAFGVREYWIIDAAKQEMLVLRRSRGRWTEEVVCPPEVYETRLLPGFEFDCAQVFEAAAGS